MENKTLKISEIYSKENGYLRFKYHEYEDECFYKNAKPMGIVEFLEEKMGLEVFHDSDKCFEANKELYGKKSAIGSMIAFSDEDAKILSQPYFTAEQFDDFVGTSGQNNDFENEGM